MERVKCVKCNDVGYTASPEFVSCKCGGNLVVVKDTYLKFNTSGNPLNQLAYFNRISAILAFKEKERLHSLSQRLDRHRETARVFCHS